MATPQISPDVLEKFRAVNEKNYQDQAIFYLNSFWNDATPASAEAENVWTLAELFAKEDHVKGKNGNELNPIQAFNLLQKQNKTLTALELKALLRKVDYDANGEMSLAEYLVGFNNRDAKAFVNNPQGEVDPALLKAAQDKLESLSLSFTELQKKEELAKQAEIDSAAAAVKAADAEKEVIKLTAEAKVIADEIAAEQKKKDDEISRLEALSTDQTVGIVKRNMAVQQLASAKNEDPLPLRKAKLSQDATVRRLEKATVAAAAATQAAHDAAAAAVEATKEVQAAIVQIQKDIEEAEVEIQKLNQSGAGQGQAFWLTRTLEEKKKSLPQRMW